VKPFDSRLANDLKPIKGSIGFTATLASLSGIALVFQSIYTAQAISSAFLSRKSISEILPYILIAATAWFLRTMFTSLNDFLSRRFGLLAVADLRRKSIENILQARNLPMPAGGVMTLITRGIEGIEIYVARYLPQLVISAIVPLGIGAVIFWLDALSALILIITIPLIPLFMALVGWFTSANVERHWHQVTRLSSTIADLLNGLPELTIFNRAKQQAIEIERLGKLQQTATMKVLRISFLSAFVLEILATISVAIIAVAIGLRLVNGEMDLWKGLAILILAPDVYAPIRMLGVHFHAAVEGMEAWNQVKIILDAPKVKRGDEDDVISEISWPDQKINIDEIQIRIPSGKVESGKITVVVGPSGIGKSSLLKMICGELDGKCSSNVLSQESFAKNVAYVDQSAKLPEGTVRELLNYGQECLISDEELISVLAGLGLALSLEQIISDRSIGVSTGQRRRLAIAHATLRSPKIMLLDEPSAALDEHSERLIFGHIKEFVRNGGAVLAVAHRDIFRKEADLIIDFAGAM
jgi:ATP-binding cassette subfamily C protein CydCD